MDEQPDVYTVEKLRSMKLEHERWSESRIDDDPVPQPIKIERDADEDSIPFDSIRSGAQAFGLVRNVQAYNLIPLAEDHTDDRIDAADAFLESAQSWGEISQDLDGLSQYRQAQRSLDSLLKDLWEKELFAWGRRLTRTISGGVLPPGTWIVAELLVMAAEDVLAEGDHSTIDDSD
ncbi:hypothetical protein OVN18_09475 [Microcella daejeonensis]|uniref:Uncharacterized protein n=1 Tax=Microcella daejeonensis TaxID=2994971 RepID=A0A9E8S7S2_9MICO|nr:hypothetical protein [Microcella daejeonensis]WAB80795.1 hypothetical protein OVN18_09475 [Microcella daejeonensis]